MYIVLGFEQLSFEDGRKGFVYYIGKPITNGIQPSFNVFCKDPLPDINVDDMVIPDLSTNKDGKLVARGLFKV